MTRGLLEPKWHFYLLEDYKKLRRWNKRKSIGLHLLAKMVKWGQVWLRASCNWCNFKEYQRVCLLFFFWPDLSNCILRTLLVDVLKQPRSLESPAGPLLGSTCKLNLGHERWCDSSHFSHSPFLFPFGEFIFKQRTTSIPTFTFANS